MCFIHNKDVPSKEILKKWIKNIEVHDKELIVNFQFGPNSVPCVVARSGFEPPTCRV